MFLPCAVASGLNALVPSPHCKGASPEKSILSSTPVILQLLAISLCETLPYTERVKITFVLNFNKQILKA